MILINDINKLNCKNDELIVAVGQCIKKENYEVVKNNIEEIKKYIKDKLI